MTIDVNHTAQWFAGRYPPKASWDQLRKWLTHTTETPSRSRHWSKLFAWPGYDAGAKAPNATLLPDLQARVLYVRQHFPENASSRALRNGSAPGETNAVSGGVHQTELVGTCSRQVSQDWQRRGLVPDVDYVEWWRPPGWVMDALAEYWVGLHRRWGVPLELGSALWPAYPSSPEMDRAARMNRRQFEKARGLLGHLHAPENEHLDPGALPAGDLLRRALAIAGGPTPTPQQEDDMPLTDQDVQRIAEAVWSRLLPSGLEAPKTYAQPASTLLAVAAADARTGKTTAAQTVAAVGALAGQVSAGGGLSPESAQAAAEAGAEAALHKLGEALSDQSGD